MTPYQQIESFFENREWFDNSSIALIDACLRKGFYAKIGPTNVPLDQHVGPGANFGSCAHACRAAYYTGYGVLPEPNRRLMAMRAFATEYERYDFKDKRGITPSAHTLDRGLDIMDAYFSHYLIEDPILKPVEAELGFAVEMKPVHGDQCIQCKEPWIEPNPAGCCDYCGWKSWINCGQIDGIFDRQWDNKRLPVELKTTKGDVAGRLRQLNFDHQPISYVTCARMFPGLENVDTFIGDVVLVAAKSMDFGRDYFTTNETQRQGWKRQVMGKVEHWRHLKRLAEGKTINEKLNIFAQNTKDCFSYGKCAFYDLCDYGISREAIENFEKSHWNPLLARVPTKTMIAAEGQFDSITR